MAGVYSVSASLDLAKLTRKLYQAELPPVPDQMLQRKILIYAFRLWMAKNV